MTTQQTHYFICPDCYNQAGVINANPRNGLMRRHRKCSGCGKEFYTQETNKGEVFDCWHVAGQNRNSIEYRERLHRYRQMKRVVKRLYGVTGEIMFIHIRQRLGIPMPMPDRTESPPVTDDQP